MKMAQNSLFAILLRKPWWVSIALVGVIALAARALVPQPYTVFGMMGGFPFLVIGVIAAWRQWQAPNPEHMAQALQKAGAMSWQDFSAVIEQAFGRQGYAVARLSAGGGGKSNHPGSGPAGAADFRLEKRGQITLLSCKRWKAASQGVEPLRDLAALGEAQAADRCIFISLSLPTDKAQRFARENGVQLICDADLAKIIV
jgi:restriction system protein